MSASVRCKAGRYRKTKILTPTLCANNQSLRDETVLCLLCVALLRPCCPLTPVDGGLSESCLPQM